MRTYRIEFIGEVIRFATYFQAITEYDAIQQGRKTYPDFTLGHVVEVMPEADHV